MIITSGFLLIGVRDIFFAACMSVFLASMLPTALVPFTEDDSAVDTIVIRRSFMVQTAWQPSLTKRTLHPINRMAAAAEYCPRTQVAENELLL